VTDEEIREFMADAPDVRTTIRHAIKWIDVQASRTAPGSTYIPRTGDTRYAR
jgi:hypothetical protein